VSSKVSPLKGIFNILIKKKAQNPVILDLREILNFCDYFIICTSQTSHHARVLKEEILKYAKKCKLLLHHIEDDPEGKWILIDFGDFIVHIFNQEARDFYDLEHLWREAKILTSL